MAHSLIDSLRFHAPDVVQERRFVFYGIPYTKFGRATDTIAGPTVGWVLNAMADSDHNREQIFILHGLKEGAKSLCVVNHISDSILFVTCLQHRISFYAVFEHIWEMIDPARSERIYAQ
jgi:hypothetical protein